MNYIVRVVVRELVCVWNSSISSMGLYVTAALHGPFWSFCWPVVSGRLKRREFCVWCWTAICRKQPTTSAPVAWLFNSSVAKAFLTDRYKREDFVAAVEGLKLVRSVRFSCWLMFIATFKNPSFLHAYDFKRWILWYILPESLTSPVQNKTVRCVAGYTRALACDPALEDAAAILGNLAHCRRPILTSNVGSWFWLADWTCANGLYIRSFDPCSLSTDTFEHLVPSALCWAFWHGGFVLGSRIVQSLLLFSVVLKHGVSNTSHTKYEWINIQNNQHQPAAFVCKQVPSPLRWGACACDQLGRLQWRCAAFHPRILGEDCGNSIWPY